jgi:5-hydroxyisourate hydrolase
LASSPYQPAPTISTHVLDTEHGAPAAGVHVTLYRLSDDGRPLRLTQALTDADGRVRDLLERPLVVGDYRLEFNLAGDRGEPPVPDTQIDRFVRRVSIDVHVADPGRSHHVPLLLAPFAITIYRGS